MFFDEKDGRKDEREVENSEDAAMANQKRMNTDPLEVMLANMGYRVPNMFESEDSDSDQVGLQCRTSWSTYLHNKSIE